ncbi:MAG: hypothetical protein QM703_03900 [Gemmatales bacterium]
MMSSMRLMAKWCLILLLSLILIGCKDNAAVEGKVKITSTEVFGKTKSMKSPPPQTPSQ